MDGAVWCMWLDITMVPYYFLELPNIYHHFTYPYLSQWFLPQIFQKGLLYSCDKFTRQYKAEFIPS